MFTTSIIGLYVSFILIATAAVCTLYLVVGLLGVAASRADETSEARLRRTKYGS